MEGSDSKSLITDRGLDSPAVAKDGAINEGQSANIGETTYPTGFSVTATMVALTLTAYLVLLDTSIVSTAIPRITSDFHSLNDVGWYGTAYLLANCTLQPLTGKLYTYFNIKWVYLVCLAIFELGSALCGAAQDSNMLIVGRAVAGIGSSGLFNGGFTFLAACVPPQRRPALTGVLIGLSQLGLLSGPLIGGALTEHTSWRWCFYINLPCAAIIAPALILVPTPDQRTPEIKSQPIRKTIPHLDLLGFAIFASSASQLLLALNWGGTTYRWDSSTIIGLFCGSGVIFILFLLWERYMGDRAMIPFSLVGRRVIWSSCLNMGFLMACSMVTTYYLPIYFQAVRGASPTVSGVDLLPSIGGTIVFGIIAGGLVTRIGHYTPLALLGATIATTGAGLLILLTPTTQTYAWVLIQLTLGIGRGLNVQMPLIAAQHNAPASQNAIATALVVLAQNLGPAVFLSLAQVVFSSGLQSELARHAPGVDVQQIVRAGAAGVRELGFEGVVLRNVLEGYCEAIVRVMYLATAASAASLVVAVGMGWGSIKVEADDVKRTGQENGNKVDGTAQGGTREDQAAGGLVDVEKVDEKA
ncbi:major facilitator superfamily domain-containing protein [Aspergillus keveii]|uniref:Major facilitator superfamily domain-containing protein n=1 Tax=Aspergillus keveii TaxID=714993 RepID=A0ABR4FQC2_9EURO